MKISKEGSFIVITGKRIVTHYYWPGIKYNLIEFLSKARDTAIRFLFVLFIAAASVFIFFAAMSILRYFLK